MVVFEMGREFWNWGNGGGGGGGGRIVVFSLFTTFMVVGDCGEVKINGLGGRVGEDLGLVSLGAIRMDTFARFFWNSLPFVRVSRWNWLLFLGKLGGFCSFEFTST